MRIFVTAGNTQTPIDRVRCITNIFTGRTGASIALEAYRRGHDVTLATSHPEAVSDLPELSDHWQCQVYRTFEELEGLRAGQLAEGKSDAVVPCAAVNDYACAGVFTPALPTHFDVQEQAWEGPGKMLDRAAGKVKSDDPELWLRLVRVPKLVDKIRKQWHFRGVLVKFKLEVDITEDALREIAEKSRQQSHADWMVANTLEGSSGWALVGNASGYEKVPRLKLAAAILDRLETEAPRG